MADIKLPHNHGKISLDLVREMSDEKTFLTVADVFKLMSDEKRVQIFWLLCHCEECVVNISALLCTSSPAVSHHLKLLKDAGLVISRKDGREVYYTAAKTPNSLALHNAIENIIDVSCPSSEAFSKDECYDSQIQIAAHAHDFLIEHIKERYTVDDLSEMFHINKTTLKSVFKRVYGKPCAAYMKEYRIKRACEALACTDHPISKISADVGYENPSKFTRAFFDVMGCLPKDYRRDRKNKE